MSEQLKLTTYFGERDRVDGRFLADALFDAYERHRVTTSVMLRGAEGFGLRHQLRSDRLLTLSEDLPAISVAVDDAERITGVVDEVVALKRKGLVTLERLRVLGGGEATGALPDEAKLTVVVGRRERLAGRPAFVAVCELLRRHGVAGASVFLGVDGTSGAERRRASFFAANARVPMLVVAVGGGERVAGALAELAELLPGRAVAVERARVCKLDGRLLERPRPVADRDERGLGRWQKLTVFGSERTLVDGRPAHAAIVRELRRSGVAGATSVRGIWGFHGDHEPHGDRLVQLRRHVPMATVVVDTPERIGAAFEIVDALTPERGLVTSELVPALVAISDGRRRGGLELARHDV